jgi:hypothetical protein
VQVVEDGRSGGPERAACAPLQLGLPPLVGFEDGSRARAEGTVVEIDDVGVEEKLLFEMFSHTSFSPEMIYLEQLVRLCR